jgi:gag-polypeptide of LTR copia-type
MSQSSGSQFSGAKLSTQNYGSWSMTFMDFLASQAEGDRLLACLTEGVGDSAAARTRDRRVLGLLRNACTVELAVHVEDCEFAADAWASLRSIVATTCATNRHELEISFTSMKKTSTESITQFVGRILQLRKRLILADEDSAPSDLSVKQVFLKGLPSSFNPIKTPYLYGPESASLSRITIAELIGYLRVYEADLEREHRSGPVKAATADTRIRPTVVKHCTYCNKDGHAEKQCFKNSAMSANTNLLALHVLCIRH